MPVEPASPDDLEALSALVDAWVQGERATNDLVANVEHDPDLRRWYVRMRGDEKSVITVWLTLKERTLHYETYVMPAPEENAGLLYEYLLRCNARLYGMRFALGAEDAVYLVGQMPLHAIDADELDRIVGASYAYAEDHFRPAMRLGFASRFRG